MLYALVLAGGKGTRLYPLSRADKPKQFLKLIDNKSFLRNTVDRIKPLVEKEKICIVTNEEYYTKVREELPEINEENIFVEPSNKETATCIGLSAIKLLKKDKDAVMMIFPSDHHINGEKMFLDTLKQSVEIADKKRALVTIGIEPTRPETGYGYIQMGPRINAGISTYKIERFTEKPNLEVAKDFIINGTYLWNSGVFVWRADVFLREMEKYLPKMYKILMEIYQHIDLEDEKSIVEEKYSLIEGISVDFGIMQRTRKAYVIKAEFQWDDIGSFEALGRFLKKEKSNNIYGNTYLEESENCTVLSEDRLVIGFGIKDLVIVEADGIILIMDKQKDQEMKQLIGNMRNKTEFKEYI